MTLIRRRFVGRISTSPVDMDGYMNFTRILGGGYTVQILLDGREQHQAITADSDNGWVEVLTHGRATFPIYQRFKGHVEIRLEKPSAPRAKDEPWEW